MTTEQTANKLPVFLIIDYAGPMWQYVSKVEHHLRSLVRQLQQEQIWPQVELIIIGMGGVTGVLKTENILQRSPGALTRKLPSSSLARALNLVVTAVTGRVTNYRVKGEVFVFLANNPRANPPLHEAMQKLEKLNVNLSPLAFALPPQPITDERIKRLKTGAGVPIHLAGKISEDQLKWLILKMLQQIKSATRDGHVAEKNEQLSQKAAAAPPQVDGFAEKKRNNQLDIRIAGKKKKPPVANWQVLEPTEATDPVPHEMMAAKEAVAGWHVVGASKRGKIHAHNGAYREDAFAIAVLDNWHMMIVADGAGSCPLSRVGSQLAVEAAVTTIKEYIQLLQESQLPVENICEIALRHSLEAAWKALEVEAIQRKVELNQLSTTFLGVIHYTSGKENVVGVVQIGDGLIVAEMDDGKPLLLAEPDVGETGGTTRFLTSKNWQAWLDRVHIRQLDHPFQMLIAMCDGVADDFIPFEQHLPELFSALRKNVLSESNQSEALLNLLGYEKQGSFDDRTLTLLYRRENDI